MRTQGLKLSNSDDKYINWRQSLLFFFYLMQSFLIEPKKDDDQYYPVVFLVVSFLMNILFVV